MLENKFYQILSYTQLDADNHSFSIHLLPDCEVYQGHFPEQPVSPGVCNLQMIKDCVEKIVGSPLRLTNLQQARFVTLVTPAEHTHLCVNIQIVSHDAALTKVKAQILAGETLCVDYKAEFSEVNDANG